MVFLPKLNSTDLSPNAAFKPVALGFAGAQRRVRAEDSLEGGRHSGTDKRGQKKSCREEIDCSFSCLCLGCKQRLIKSQGNILTKETFIFKEINTAASQVFVPFELSPGKQLTCFNFLGGFLLLWLHLLCFHHHYRLIRHWHGTHLVHLPDVLQRSSWLSHLAQVSGSFVSLCILPGTQQHVAEGNDGPEEQCLGPHLPLNLKLVGKQS